MKVTTTLFRRTVVSLSAIAALIVTGYAASQSVVELRNANGTSAGSCSYSSMTVSPSGGVIVTCSSSSSSASFSVAAPSSLPVSTTTTTQVSILRSGATTGTQSVAWNVTGTGCTSDGGTIDFAAGTGGSQPIVITTGASTPASCLVSITPPAGLEGTPLSKTINVVDPNAPVTFAFSASSFSAQIGNGNTAITATRSGGTANAWTVPVTLAGDLAPTGTLPTANGTLSSLTFSFPANSSTASITYTPPTVMPAASTLSLSLGTPAGGAGGQTGSVVAPTSATMTLSGPAAGCPASSIVAQNPGASGTVNVLRGESPAQSTFTLPIPVLLDKPTHVGRIDLYQAPYTPTKGAVKSEISISKCKGDFTDRGDACYKTSDSYSQVGPIIWMDALTTKYSSIALVKQYNRCWAPPAEGPWYINVRVTYTSGACDIWGTCGWQPIWKAVSQ